MFNACEEVLVDIEVAEKVEAKFKRDYQKIAGFVPKGYKTVEDKWDCEARVYFNGTDIMVANLDILGYPVETLKEDAGYQYHWADKKFKHRVTNKMLFWALTRNGFKIGNNKKKTDVANAE